MSMYNLLEYSFSYFDTAGSLWFYCKVEATNFNNDIRYNNAFKSFKYIAKLLETQLLNLTQIKLMANYKIQQLKSNFWRSFKILLINCKVELKLKAVLHSRKSM